MGDGGDNPAGGDDPALLPLSATTRRRTQIPSEGKKLSFKERREIVVAEKLATDIVASKIDNHISSCESFRKLLLTGVGVIISIVMVPMGFMLTEIYQIKGRQEVVLATLVSINNSATAEKESISGRLASIVSANAQREQTIHSRIADLSQQIVDLQKEFHGHELRTKGVEYEPSSGPTRRR